MEPDSVNEPWWFAELDPTNRVRAQELFATEREAAARYARELADLRIKLALTSNEVERITEEFNMAVDECNRLQAQLERMRPHLHAQWKAEIDETLGGSLEPPPP